MPSDRLPCKLRINTIQKSTKHPDILFRLFVKIQTPSLCSLILLFNYLPDGRYTRLTAAHSSFSGLATGAVNLSEKEIASDCNVCSLNKKLYNFLKLYAIIPMKKFLFRRCHIMFPDKETAIYELETAGKMNPGRWTAHSYNVANAAKRIAENCRGLDGSKAFVCGLLHDIGRRVGVVSMKHVIAGYEYAMRRGWDEVAKICMTHSYPIQDIKKDIAKIDVTEKEYKTIQKYLEKVVYDAYDHLIILCDSLTNTHGFCILEKRFVDTTRRYGMFPFTVERWNATFAIKEEFEKKMGCSVYSVLPGIERTTLL